MERKNESCRFVKKAYLDFFRKMGLKEGIKEDYAGLEIYIENNLG